MSSSSTSKEEKESRFLQVLLSKIRPCWLDIYFWLLHPKTYQGTAHDRKDETFQFIGSNWQLPEIWS